MPTYDYRSLATGQVFEVRHPLAMKAHTWAELCQIGQLDPGDIAPDSPVERLVSAAGVVSAGTLHNPEAPPCATGKPCCGGGGCGYAA